MTGIETGGAGEASRPVLDVLGVGFGPSNLALAIAVEEHNRTATPADRLHAHFVERQPRFGWHRGMLLDDATMQVSFLKDLVTMRNPASDFSFVSYLHAQDRLVDFICHKVLFPLRVEFHDYFEWAAARVEHLVRYGHEVIDVVPVEEAGTIVAFDVSIRSTSNPAEVTLERARHLVIAVGLEMSLPDGVELGPRVWHNLDLLRRVETLPVDPEPRRFVVVGAGQSAAEAVDFFHRTYADAEVCSVFAKYGYVPADDTPFANRIFDPEAVDVYFDARSEVKRMLFDYHRNTNYSVVDQDLIGELYRRVYQEKVLGRPRLQMLNVSRVVDVVAGDGVVDVTVEYLPTGERTTLEADVLVYATGYQPVDALRLLGRAGSLCERDAEGLLELDRDYRVAMLAPAQAGIYLQGGTEHTHGITSTLLSNVAVRSGELVRSMLKAS